MKSSIFYLLSVLSSQKGVESFIVSSKVPSLVSSTTLQASESESSSSFSRHDFFKSLVVGTATTFLTTTNIPTAYAQDEPSSSTSSTTNKISSKASLRYIKRAIKEFETLELYASMNDYTEMKQGIRNPGLSEIRKNCFVLIKNSSDNEEDSNKLTGIYGEFIKHIEKLDSDASLGFRGRKGIELQSSYDAALKDLKTFVEVADVITNGAVSAPAVDSVVATVAE